MWAAEERQKMSWDHTCELLATMVNCKAGKHVASGRKLNPFRTAAKTVKPLYLDDLEEFLFD